MTNKRSFIVLALCSLFLIPIQAQELLNYPLDTVNGEEVYRYEVEKSIGLYRIGVNFDVSQSEIVRFNPQLKERGLHFGETLLIPTKRPVVKKPVIPEIVIPVAQDTLVPEVKDTIVPAVKDTLIPEHRDTVDTIQDTRRVIELALMLPFESHQTQRSGNAERMMEFYQGVLLALRDVQEDSLLYRLRVYDTERSERRVAALCDSTELDSVRGILGLVYPIQIERMATWCQTHQVPLLLPFSDDADLTTNPYLLQFNSTDTQEADSLCAWIEANDSLLHCVAINVRESEMTNSIRALHKQLKKHHIRCSSMNLRDLMNDSAAYALDTAKENLVILHSDKWQQARVLIPHLQQLRAAGFRIRILSQYSWQKESINLPQVYTSVFTADGLREAYDIQWSQSFVNGHVSETPRYDLLGYDLMRALVGWLNGEQSLQGIQSDIRWTPINEGGYQNTCVRVITY